MLPIYNIREARRAAKKSQTDAAEAIDKHRDALNRLETGDVLNDIDTLAKLYGHRAVLLSKAEYEIFGQIMAILANFGQNRGKSGE